MRTSVIVIYLGMAVLRPVSPHLLLGSSHGQREDHTIGGSYMRKMLGICTSVTGINITNSIEKFNQKKLICMQYILKLNPFCYAVETTVSSL